MPLKQVPGKQFKCIHFSAKEVTGLRKKKKWGWACQPPKARRNPQTTSECEDSVSGDGLKTKERYYKTPRCYLEGEILLRNLKEEKKKKR